MVLDHNQRFFFPEHGANEKTQKSPVQGKIPIGIFFAQTQSLQYREKKFFRSNSKSPVQGIFFAQTQSL